MLTEAILLYVISLIANADWFTGTSQLSRPIVIGPMVGLAMGDLQAGIIMGANFELAFIGAVSIGAYIPPDMVTGTILGVAFAIKAGVGVEAALAIGMPVATVALMINTVLGTPISLAFTHAADRCAERGDTRGIDFYAFIAPWLSIISFKLIIPAAYYLGSDVVVNALSKIPGFVETGMNIACGIIPAIGFGMLAQMIMHKKVAPYFFIGYFLVVYFQLNTTAVALFAIMIAVIMTFGDREKQNTIVRADNNQEVELDEF